jgi:hypothetical protein
MATQGVPHEVGEQLAPTGGRHEEVSWRLPFTVLPWSRNTALCMRAPEARPAHVYLCERARVLKQPASITAGGDGDAVPAQATSLPEPPMPCAVVGDVKERPLQDLARSSGASTPSSKSGDSGLGAWLWVAPGWLRCDK